MSLKRASLLALVLSLVLPAIAWAQADDEATAPAPQPSPVGQVRAVLFYSPACPHCHDVMYKDLPPLQEIFGDGLQVVFLRTDKDYGGLLYDIANERYAVEDLDQGVPMMVVGDHALVGGREIRETFPVLVASYLEGGGVDWPDIPGLRDVIGVQQAIELMTEQPPGAQPPAAATDPAQPAQPTMPIYGAPGVGPTPVPPGASGPGASGDAAATSQSAASQGDAAATQGSGSDRDDGVGDADEARGDDEDASDATDDAEAGAGVATAGSGDARAETESAEGPNAVSTKAAAALANVETMPTVPPEAFELPAEDSTVEKVMRDPVGNGMSIVLLLVMLVALVAALWPSGWQHRMAASPWPARLIPFLAIIGLAVAAYLAYVETTLSEAFCGPVGDCNAVQQSSYARLLGIPIAWLGFLGYVLILALWGVARFSSRAKARWAWAFLFVVSVGGVLFSIYLTFLEPFVIGATCAWCLSSAAIMTAILLLSSGQGHEALRAEPDRPAGRSAGTSGPARAESSTPDA